MKFFHVNPNDRIDHQKTELRYVISRLLPNEMDVICNKNTADERSRITRTDSLMQQTPLDMTRWHRLVAWRQRNSSRNLSVHIPLLHTDKS